MRACSFFCRGTEFTNATFLAYLKTQNIYFSPQSSSLTKACFVEERIKVLKQKLYRMLHFRLSNDWTPDIIAEATRAINDTPSVYLGLLNPRFVQFCDEDTAIKNHVIIETARNHLGKKQELSLQERLKNQEEYKESGKIQIGDWCLIPSREQDRQTFKKDARDKVRLHPTDAVTLSSLPSLTLASHFVIARLPSPPTSTLHLASYLPLTWLGLGWCCPTRFAFQFGTKRKTVE